MENKYSILYRLPLAVIIIGGLIGWGLAVVSGIFTRVCYGALADIFSNMFNFSGTGDAMLMNQIIPGLGTMGSIFGGPSSGGRLTLFLLIIGVAVVLFILGIIFWYALSLVKENKVIATICSLLLAGWVVLSFYNNIIAPWDVVNFGYCVLALVVIAIQALLTLIMARGMFGDADFD